MFVFGVSSFNTPQALMHMDKYKIIHGWKNIGLNMTRVTAPILTVVQLRQCGLEMERPQFICSFG